MNAKIDHLLAIDLGVRTGLALYGDDARLRWYRSKNFGSIARLKRGAHSLLAEIDNLAWLVLEGGGNVANIWIREADRRNITVVQISANTWRQQLFYYREQRSGLQAKQTADTLARRVIEWSNAPRPTSLRHDAAEAILVGLWGVLEVGWLDQIPREIR